MGSRLPTVRALALQFNVNPATIQRSLSRLEATGLVVARQGSGTEVRDPVLAGDLSLVPAWLEALCEQPVRAAQVLGEFLEVRRLVVLRLVVRHREVLIEHGPELLAEAARLGEAAGVGLEDMARVDLEVAHLFLKRVDNTIGRLVLNTARQIYVQVPEVAQAMYADPQLNLLAMRAVFEAMTGDASNSELADLVETRLAEVDASTVQRFQDILSQE